MSQNSILNNTTGILTLKSKCDTAELKSQCTYFKRPLVVCDCEGYELELFNEQATAAALSRSDVIIECHDFITAGTTETLKATFAHTHDVSVVYAGERNPNLFPFMQDIYDIDRWQAVCEHRPCVMNWIICESRQYRSPVSRVLRKLRLRSTVQITCCFHLTPLFRLGSGRHRAQAALRISLQRGEEGGVAEKRRRSSIAALRDLAPQSGNDDASQTGHSRENGAAVDFRQ